MFVKKQFGYDDIYFRACSKDLIFVKKSGESHIIKCINAIFQELFSEFNYPYYFFIYVLMKCCKRDESYCMTGGTTSLTIPKLKNMEESLVSPHWLVTTCITPSFSSSKTNLANNHSESNPKHWQMCCSFFLFFFATVT